MLPTARSLQQHCMRSRGRGGVLQGSWLPPIIFHHKQSRVCNNKQFTRAVRAILNTKVHPGVCANDPNNSGILFSNPCVEKKDRNVPEGKFTLFPGAILFKYDDVIKWNYFPRYWPFVRGIHRAPVISLHKGQWRGALMFCLICTWINSWVNNREAGDLSSHSAHYDVSVIVYLLYKCYGESTLL